MLNSPPLRVGSGGPNLSQQAGVVVLQSPDVTSLFGSAFFFLVCQRSLHMEDFPPFLDQSPAQLWLLPGVLGIEPGPWLGASEPRAEFLLNHPAGSLPTPLWESGVLR